jgi:hypothetical protein
MLGDGYELEPERGSRATIFAAPITAKELNSVSCRKHPTDRWTHPAKRRIEKAAGFRVRRAAESFLGDRWRVQRAAGRIR